jgi:PAS domain S-box-containing protein
MTDIAGYLFESFADAMPLGTCLVDTQAKIIYWNAAAEGITGYLGAEVIGRSYRDDLLVRCVAGGAESEPQCPVKEVLRDGRAVMAELFLRHKDGHRVPVHVCAFPLRDANGEVRGVGELLEPEQTTQEANGWSGHSEREFEMATGLPAEEESREKLQMLIRQPTASTTALVLIEMSEHESIQRHGGTAMLHQAIRLVAKTILGRVPARSYLGCWSDWRLIVIVPECSRELLEALRSKLAGAGSSCAVKWWGDRVVVGIHAAACYLDSAPTVGTLIQALEQELKSIPSGEE